MRLGDAIIGLGRPIAYYPSLAPVCGGVNAALMLCQLAYWTGREKGGDGWVYKTQADWKQETGLSRIEQENARRQLRSRGLLQEERRGLPAQLFYRLDLDVLDIAWISREPDPDPGEGDDQDGMKPPVKSAGNQQASLHETDILDRMKHADISYPETTAEITSETTTSTASRASTRSLRDIFKAETGKAPTPAQERKLTAYLDAAAGKGRPDIVAEVIRYTAELGKDWAYLCKVMEGCITEQRSPYDPNPNRPTPFNRNQRITASTHTDEEAMEWNREQMERFEADIARLAAKQA